MPEPNFRNRTLFHGDNLKFLQAIDSGMVHLIATDPPFNKSRDFHATPDSLAAGGKFEDRWRYDKGRPSGMDRRHQGRQSRRVERHRYRQRDSQEEGEAKG